MTEGEHAVGISGATLWGPPTALRELRRKIEKEGLGDDVPVPCLASLCAQLDERAIERGAATGAGMLQEKMGAIDDDDGSSLEVGVETVVDAHVHLFPDGVFNAIWRWFEAYGWPIRYQLHSPDVIRFLNARGVSNLVALHYAHKPKMAATLNAYMETLVADHPSVVGLATVFPGEDDAIEILTAAFDAGLRGVKLHCHVQAFAADSPKMDDIYSLCVRRDRPLLMHAGREPKSPHYRVDTHAVCAAERVEEVLRNYPRLKLVVPHLGADEFDAYLALFERYDNLWVDTTMMAANFFATGEVADAFLARRPERVLYGTDFPNLPYAWDREAKRLMTKNLDDDTREQLFSRTARDLFAIESVSGGDA